MHLLIQEFDVLDPLKVIPLKQKCDHDLIWHISELKTPRWVKIGKVANLHCYPLISGKEYAVDECHMTLEKMEMFKKGKLIKWDRLV